MSTVLPGPSGVARLRTEFYGPIKSDLAAVETVLRETLASSRPVVNRLVGHLENYQGKRLRPALLLLAARACGKVTPAHHILGAVVEMIHTATLVHDDVLDDATVRRHMPTVNAAWSNQTSILLGDYLFTHAFHLASSVDARACRIIGDATNHVCEGELLQCVECGNLDLTEEEYLQIIEGKTAELTACCCRMGALYTGMSGDVVEKLAAFGRMLGMAFQIADDLLDLVGDERTTGKSLGTDVDQRKLTLPVIYLLKQASLAEAAEIRNVLHNQANHKREALRPLLLSSGALAYAEHRAESFAAQARAELKCLPPSECSAILADLTDRVIHRRC
jgi:octaprenyl-diphosphate synthase